MLFSANIHQNKSNIYLTQPNQTEAKSIKSETTHSTKLNPKLVRLKPCSGARKICGKLRENSTPTQKAQTTQVNNVNL